MGNDIVSTSRENLEQFIRERVKGSDLNRRYLCDYVDSSMACNVSLCKIANDTLYGRGFTVAQRDNPMRRTCTYGHAIELVNIVDNVEISLGAYTIIIDRYAEKSMGYDKKEYPNILIAEGESNSDTGASSLHAYTNPESSGSQFANETEYINEGFKIVYPPTNEAAYDFADLKELVNFVDLASEDDFKDSFENFFNKESVLKYYLFCLCFASVDTLAKNLHFARYTDVWYILPYDLDSVLGGSNVGFLNISSSCEVGNVYDEKNPEVIVEPNQFNSWNGRLWARIRNIFAADLTAMWSTLRSNGTFNYDNFIKYFNEIWDAIPPTMYNSSQQIKYIDYGTTGQVALHGNRKHQIKKFLRERLAYLDSKFGFYSDGGAENYANIRMNVLGDVSLTIETYYPVYYTIKWATNNIETHRIAKNTKYTFSYFSDVSTDREVLLYLPHTLKSIENLDSLQPASIDVSKATKLTKLEVHSEKLYSVNVTNNKYLRTIDFNGCKLLGTDTISTLSILYAKYLKYLDVRGTQLTAVNFSPQGGSIVDCYLPNTITSLTVQNQLLLTNLIIPGGENTPRDLATVTIDNCPLITKLSDVETSYPFDVFKYCRTLNINNSFLTMNEIVFDGFTRLQSVSLSNMEALTDLGLNDLCVKGETSTLRYIGISSCKNLTELSLNCTSNNYEIAFANSSLLDLSTSNVTELRSNCVMKGLNTIVLPVCIENMYFTNEYGTGYSDVRNIWSASTAVVDTSGVFPVARHMNYNTNIVDEYEGIDFYGLHLYNIDLGALVNIPDAINFSLYPTSVNPNFNLHRDGVEHPFLQPSGILDLSNYTESLARFFNGVNLDKLYVACRNDLPQTDLSYCFYGSTFSNPSRLDNVLNHIKSVSSMEYCFYKTSIDSTEILNNINIQSGCSLAYCFGFCPNITTLSDVTISASASSVEGLFQGSGLTTVTNFEVLCQNVIGLFKDCGKLMTVTNFTAPNTTSYKSLCEGCTSLVNPPITVIPDNILDISYMYKNCPSMVSIDGMVFNKNLTAWEGFIADSPNIVSANSITIKGSYYQTFFNEWTSVKYMNNLLTTFIGKSMSFNNMFNGMTNLEEFSFHDDSYVKDVVSMDYLLANTSISKVDLTNVYFERLSTARYLFQGSNMKTIEFHLPETIANYNNILSDCPNLEEIKNVTFSRFIATAANWINNSPVKKLTNCQIYSDVLSFVNNPTLETVEGLIFDTNTFKKRFSGCTALKTVDITFGDKVTDLTSGFEGCPSLVSVDFNSSPLPNMTTFNTLFNGDTSLTTINNFIVNENASCGREVLIGCPIDNLDGCQFNSQASMEMFKMGSNSCIREMSELPISENVKDLSYLFTDYPYITHDLTIPNHVTNVTSMYENCPALTHVQTNWTNNYINGIVPTNCYSGCNNVSHINDELYMNEYGELTAIYQIPPEWGGILNLDSYTTVFEIEITEEQLQVTLEAGDSELTEWGDLNIDRQLTHNYSSPGRYLIKTNLPNPLSLGKGNISPLAGIVTKVKKITGTSFTNTKNLFKDFVKLEEACELEGVTNINTLESAFEGCISLKHDIKIPAYITNVINCFKGCDSMVRVHSNWNDSYTNNITPTDCYLGCSSIEYIDNEYVIHHAGDSGINYIPEEWGGNVFTATTCFYVNVVSGSLTVELNTDGAVSVTDWGDNTIGREVIHTYNEPGLYYIQTNLINPFNIGTGVSSPLSIVSNVTSVSKINCNTFTSGDYLFNGFTSLTSIENLSLTGVTTMISAFEGCVSLTHDILIPSHITNCTNCFKGCTSMTHVHSNWKKTYTNGITATDCYAGCTGITHIDGENVISYNGDSGVDYIPLDWGGNGFTKDCTTIYEINVTDEFVNKPLQPIGTWSLLALDSSVARVNWGDGSPSEPLCVNNKVTTHIYTTTGIYYVKAHASMGHGYGAGFAGALSKILQVTKYEYGRINSSLSYACSGAKNMTYADFSNIAYEKGVTKFNLADMFANCNKLKTVILPSGLRVERCDEMFLGCLSIESVDLSSLVVSDVKYVRGMFKGCGSLKSLDLSHFNISNVNDLTNMFNGCSSLTYLNITGWDFKNVTNVSNMLSNVGLQTIDTSTWLNTGNITNFGNFCNGATTEYITLTFSGSMWAVMHTCKNVKHVTWKNCTVVIDDYSFPSHGVYQTAKWQITFDNAVISAENGTKGMLNSYNQLTVESLMSVINALADRTGIDSDTLTIGSANLAKLTPEQIKVATDKNWTVV